MREELVWLCAFFDAFTRRDEQWMHRHVPESFRYQASTRFPEGMTVYTGPDGVFELLRFIDESFGGLELGTPSITDHGEVVLVDVPVRARTRDSDIPIDGRPAQIWRFEHGVPASAQSYIDRADALQALRDGEAGAG